MARLGYLMCWCILQTSFAVKVKVVMHSEQDDSKIEDEDTMHTETTWDHKKRSDSTMLPFIKRIPIHKHEEKPVVVEYEDDKPTTAKPRQMHPNEMIFPLIYRQNHINSMFKFGENWYTWSVEKRTDGSKATNYYICYDEPKHCDEVGWERTDTLPKCAFQIDSLLPEDRACVNNFGVEPHPGNICDGAEQMKISEMVRACGPRIRSLWRFARVGRRPAHLAKPADVNSLVCEDEEECFLTIEYRIHHDRITFSLHEPTRGQTFKSILKRELNEEEKVNTVVTESHPRVNHRSKKVIREEPVRPKKFHNMKTKAKPTEGKASVKERNDSAYGNRRMVKNRIKIKEDISEDMSE